MGSFLIIFFTWACWLCKASSADLKECLVPSPRGECLICRESSYKEEMNYSEQLLWQDYFDIDLLPCRGRNSSLLTRRILISSVSDLNCVYCPDWNSFEATYFDLGEGLIKESRLASKYNEGEISFFLFGSKPHILFLEEAKKGIQFFRGSNININIDRWNCSVLLSFEERSLNCKNASSQTPARIWLKTGAFEIYVTKKLNFFNVELIGSDLILNGLSQFKNIDCMLRKEICCIYDPPAAGAEGCEINISPDFSERIFSSSNPSLFVLELFFDPKNPSLTPSLRMENVTITNMTYSYLGGGFHALIKIQSIFGSSVFLRNLSLVNSYLLEGLIKLNHNYNLVYSLSIGLTSITDILFGNLKYSKHFISANLIRLSTALKTLFTLNQSSLANFKSLFRIKAASLFIHIEGLTLNKFQLDASLVILSLENCEGELLFENFQLQDTAIAQLLSASGIASQIVFKSVFIAKTQLTGLNPVEVIDSMAIIFNILQLSENFIDPSLFVLYFQNVQILLLNGLNFSSTSFTNIYIKNCSAAYFEKSVFKQIQSDKYFIVAEKSWVSLYLVTLDKLGSDFSLFFFQKSDYFFRETVGSHLEASAIINAQNIQIHSLKDSSFSNIFKSEHFWSPGSVFHVFLIRNCTFSSSEYLIFLSAYVPNEFMKFVSISDSKFFNLNIREYLFEFCCITLIWSNCLVENVIIDSNTGRALAAFETKYVYLLSHLKITNTGFPSPVINKYLSQSLFHSFFFLFFPTAVSLNNITLVNEFPNTTLTSGVISSGNQVEYIIINCLSISVNHQTPHFKGLTLSYTKTVWIINSTFQFLKCSSEKISQYHQSGVIGIFNFPHFGGDRTNDYSLFIIKTVFKHCSCNFGGTIAIVNYYSVAITDCIFDRIMANEAGAIFIIASQSLILFRNYLTNSSSFKGSSVITLNQVDYAYFINNTVLNGLSLENGAVFLKRIGMIYVNGMEGKTIASYLEGGFFFLDETSLHLYNSFISNIISFSNGGVIYSQSICKIFLKQTLVDKASAQIGGVIMAEDTSIISIEDALISNCRSALSSSIIDLSSYFSFSLKNVIIRSCYTEAKGTISLRTSLFNHSNFLERVSVETSSALFGTALYIESAAHLSIKYLTVMDCKGRSLIDLPVRTLINIFISDSLFKRNRVGSIFVSVMSSAYFINTTIINNMFSAYVFAFQHSIMNFLSLVTKDNLNTDEIHANSINLFYFYEANLTAENILFYPSANNSSQFGIALCVTGCFLFLRNITANPFYQEDCTLIQIIDGSIFLSNLTIATSSSTVFKFFQMDYIEVQDLQLIAFNTSGNQSNTLMMVSMSNKAFLKNFILYLLPSSNIILSQISYIIIDKIVWFKPESQAPSENSSLSILESQKVEILRNRFFFSKGRQGGCITIRNIHTEYLEINISDSIFIRNVGETGGAIYIFAQAALLSSTSCVFYQNKAINFTGDSNFDVGAAGVMYIVCANNINCSLFIRRDIFLENFASNYAPNIYSEGLIFEQPPGNLYVMNSDGANFTNRSSSLPMCITVKGTNELLLGSATVSCGEEVIKMNIKSGVAFNLTIELLDKQGQTLVFHSSTIAYIKSRDREVVLSQKESLSNKGIINFYDINVKQNPNTSSIAFLYLKHSYDVTGFVLTEFPLVFKSLSCMKGEMLQVDLKCSRCLPGTYYRNYTLNKESFSLCEKCLKGFDCLGGEFIFPRKGFWRFRPDSDLALKCITPDACTSYSNNDKIEEKPCADGHEGILCHQCSMGYGKLQRNTMCIPCDQGRPLYVVRIVLFSLFFAIYVIANTLIFTETMRSKGDSSSPFIVLKILLNHLQQISVVCFTEDVSGLPLLQNFAIVQYYISFINEDIVSVECVLQKYYQSSYSQFHKVLITLLLPLGFGILAIIFWVFLVFFYYLLKTNKKSSSRHLRKILVGFTICAYLLYPMMIQKIFSLTNCMTLLEGQDDKQSNSYIYESPNIKCWTPSHMKYFYGLFLPSVIIWGIFFPAALFRTLRRNWKTITHVEASLKDLHQNPLQFNNDGRDNEISVRRRNNLFGANKPGSVMKIKKTPKYELEKVLKDSQVFRFFYEDYCPERFYWEIVIFMKKFILTMFVSSTQIISSDLNFTLQVVVLVIYSVLVFRLEPFLISRCNFYEFTSSVLTFLSKLLIMIIVSPNIGNTLTLFLSALILLMNAAWILSILLFFSRIFYQQRKRRRSAMKNSGKNKNNKSSINLLKALFIHNKQSQEDYSNLSMEVLKKNSIEPSTKSFIY